MQKQVSFHVCKDSFRRMPIVINGEKVGYEVSIRPRLSDYLAGQIPDHINPRSHGENILSGKIAKEIARTIIEKPEQFRYVNRGITDVAADVKYDPDKSLCTIVWDEPDCIDGSQENYAKPIHGNADGGTTDAVIANIQANVALDLGYKKFSDIPHNSRPKFLHDAEVNIQVFTGIQDEDLIADLCMGRNYSKAVSGWSLADLEGRYNWIKQIVDSEDSPYKGLIGFDEYADKDVLITDLLGYLYLLLEKHNVKLSAKRKGNITLAYNANKRLDQWLSEEEMQFKVLSNLIIDILTLSEDIQVLIPDSYKRIIPGGKPGARGKKDEKAPFKPLKTKKRLPLTGRLTEYEVNPAMYLPMLCSLRAIIDFKEDGSKAEWLTNPRDFILEHIDELLSVLLMSLEQCGNVPNKVGKSPIAYEMIYRHAKALAHADGVFDTILA